MLNPQHMASLTAQAVAQAVEAPTLSIMVPLLLRGLRERATAIKRKSCLIIDNMAKLVDNPNDAAVFLPRLLPGVEKVRWQHATSSDSTNCCSTPAGSSSTVWLQTLSSVRTGDMMREPACVRSRHCGRFLLLGLHCLALAG